ncbi:hypothetical protein ACFP1I_28340 [Dyadobacter subterraneus]|uniref:Uncharacterized protein n=1 Tax=Dyadobacter subterraneus TaxID=2773304 RepID=A0ABR9WCY4_9BACT|nr:hypothetical protein [Dyadobacter subterraneus]MBE9463277.1 hypothetical protein [Dyadobacter subterraneus]
MTSSINNQPYSARAVHPGIKTLSAFFIYLLTSSTLYAQFNVTMMMPANYKRPFGTLRNNTFIRSETLFTIKENLPWNGPINVRNPWRYHRTPALLVIAVNSKSRMEINPLMIKSNYKVQHRF